MPYILLLVLIGLVGCAPESVPVPKEVEPVLEQEIEDVPVEALYPDFDSFLSAIQLKNVSKLGSTEKFGFYYEIREGDLKAGVRKFNPIEYYSLFQNEEAKLTLAVTNLSQAYLVKGLREISPEQLPVALKKHNKLIDPTTPFFREEKSRLTEKLLTITKKASANPNSIKPEIEADVTKLVSDLAVQIASNTVPDTKDEVGKEGTLDDEAETVARELVTTELIQLAYIYDLNGEYEIARLIEEKLCESFEKRCKPEVQFPIYGSVLDLQGEAIPKAVVGVLNYPDTTVSTNRSGGYEISYKGQSPQKVRMRAVAPGYSDAYKDFYIVSNAKNQERERNFTLMKAHGVVRFDTNGRSSQPFNLQASLVEEDFSLDSVEGIATAQYTDDSLILTTDLTQYTIPLDGFVRSSGTKYKGTLTAYVYEFDKDSNVTDLLRVDASDAEGDFFGSMLKTFGMPFIQFYDDEGSEVFIDRSNPMVIVSQIAEMEALKAGSDGVYDPLTDDHLQLLLDYSNESITDYPITREYLIQNELVMFPQWWVLDRLKGKWAAEPFKLLNLSGLVETIFYSIDFGLSDLTGVVYKENELDEGFNEELIGYVDGDDAGMIEEKIATIESKLPYLRDKVKANANWQRFLDQALDEIKALRERLNTINNQ